MIVRFMLATVVGGVGVAAAVVAPWPWLAVSILIAMPMTLGVWLVARLTGPELVVRHVRHQASPGPSVR